ncbi:sulfatase-like hydrolase/transferase [Planctomycetota bacterium]
MNTPNLERLARSGMVFSQAYAAASVCSPTRASCMTGMSPIQGYGKTGVTLFNLKSDPLVKASGNSCWRKVLEGGHRRK